MRASTTSTPRRVSKGSTGVVIVQLLSFAAACRVSMAGMAYKFLQAARCVAAGAVIYSCVTARLYCLVLALAAEAAT